MTTGGSWIIGDKPSCDVVVEAPTVSGQHCRLTQTPHGFLLEDFHSSNGTFVNDQRIESPVNVSRSDTITLGRCVPMPWPEVQEFEPTETIRIGRLPDNDVVLDDPVVSGYHAQILSADEEHWIEDFDSTNGTAIGSLNNKISRAPLSEGDAVFFGSLRIPASRLLSSHFSMGYEPCTAVQVEQHESILGRDATCDLALDDPKVSRRHARLMRMGDEITVEDLGSTNGTFVNGNRIRGKSKVRPGDVITVGSHTFTVTSDGNLEQRDWRGNVAIEARGLTIDVLRKRLLDGISLTIYPSEFVGLMGPSGAGKTTLMMALNGYTVPSAGDVNFNGVDLYANFKQFQGTVGYVPQDDIMHGDLTVGQALYFTARLRLPVITATKKSGKASRM
jgi:pSer/pThr/pTyr-binding forkhead associated (FHA) protein